MTPRQLADIGARLYGKNWKSPLSRALGMSYVQILKYAKGRAFIPRTVDLAVRFLRDHPETAARSGRRDSAIKQELNS